MDTDADNKKWANFYYRLKKQYEDSKPIIYELDPVASTQQKPRAAKFTIIIAKFISIFKWGIRQTYENQDDRKDNYWTQLSKHFKNDYEIGFVNQEYWDKPKNKLRIYFSLLMYTKRIFTVLEKIVAEMGYLFINEQEKRKNFEVEIKSLSFFADGQYQVMGELITKYQEYYQKRKEKERIEELAQIKRKQEEQKQRKRKQEEEKQRQKQIARKKQQERLAKQKAEALKQKEAEQAKKKKQLQKTQNVVKKNQTIQKIGTDFFPSYYISPISQTATVKSITRQPKPALTVPNEVPRAKKMRNSQKLFEQNYKDDLSLLTYKLKPQISQNQQNCAMCKQPLKKGIYILGGNKNMCYYSGQWFCNNCIEEERMPIPWKAIQSFDLRGYTVSKKSGPQLRTYYNKAIVQIHKDNPIITNNQKFNEFIVIKRQIHLIYDSICNTDLVENVIKNRVNYCPQVHLFSMKNLYDIYNGQQTKKLERDYEILSKHFYGCPICQSKKGYICPICNSPFKIFPFEVKETYACKSCRKLYHQKCLRGGGCKCKQQQ